MEFNEYIRWTAEDIENLELAECACMAMYEKTGDWEWLSTARTFYWKALNLRMHTRSTKGWYLV